jgi:hypothetical protein
MAMGVSTPAQQLDFKPPVQHCAMRHLPFFTWGPAKGL